MLHLVKCGGQINYKKMRNQHEQESASNSVVISSDKVQIDSQTTNSHRVTSVRECLTCGCGIREERCVRINKKTPQELSPALANQTPSYPGNSSSSNTPISVVTIDSPGQKNNHHGRISKAGCAPITWLQARKEAGLSVSPLANAMKPPRLRRSN